MPRVFRRAAANRDLIDHFVYLAENASVEVADRFLARVEESFYTLAEHRAMGIVLTLQPPELQGLRKWQVKDFEQFLIFYLPRSDGVSIVRVIHAAQDWWGKLGIA